jgi:hypothetical protein
MADNNFVVKNGLTVNGSFTANSTVVNTAAVTATSVNAASLSISGSSVATLISSNAATAYSNAASYADTKSNAAYANAVAIATNASNLSSGLVPTARLASGSASSSTYLRGDQTWASVAAGSSGTVTSVGSGTGLTGGPITTTGTLSLATAGSGAATYSSGISAITVDSYGRVTSVTGSAGYVSSSGYGYSSSPIFNLITTNSIVASSEVKSGSFVATSSTYYLTTNYGVYMNYDGSTYINFSNGIRVPASVQIGGGEYGAKNVGYSNSARSVVLYLDAAGTHGLSDTSGGYSRWFSPNNGDFNTYGTLYQGFSDARLKTNITTIPEALAKVNRINGVSFNMNELAASFGFKDSKTTYVGVLANEIEAVLPEAVAIAPFDADHKDDVVTSKSGENYKTVQYEKIVPLLIEAIKELNNKTDEALAAKDVTINSLKTNIADLQAQINLLKK